MQERYKYIITQEHHTCRRREKQHDKEEGEKSLEQFNKGENLCCAQFSAMANENSRTRRIHWKLNFNVL